MAQIQPFSRQDSALLNSAWQGYEKVVGENSYKEAAYHLNEIAYLFWDHNNYKEAIKYYEQSLAFNERIGNENGIAMIANNLGMLYSDIGNYDTSLDYFQKTLATRRAKKESVAITAALINIAVVKNTLKKYDEAVVHLEEAMALAREKNDLKQILSCYGMLAETFQKKGDAKQSLYYFEFYKSFSELLSKNKIKNVEEALDKMKLTQKSTENKRIAVEQQLSKKEAEINELKQKIGEANTILSSLNKELSTKNTQLDLARQDKEIFNLKAEKKQQLLDEESKKRQSNLFFAGLIIVFLLLLFLVATTSSKKINIKNAELFKKNEKIIRINEALEKANNVKDTLFSSIAHDLKAPLGQLELTLSFLDDDMLDEGEKELMLSAVGKGLKQSNLLLENLLVWANSQMYGCELQEKEVDLQSAIDESIYVLESLYQPKHLIIEKKFNHTSSIYTDEGKLKLIIRNLTSNAIKFTPKNGRITLTTGILDNHVSIEVSDTGVGMTEKQIAKLFDYATNTTTYGTDKEKGTGIGLKICHQFIQEMQGEIKVKSVLNQGTTFTVRIPIKKLNSTNTTNEKNYSSGESVLPVS